MATGTTWGGGRWGHFRWPSNPPTDFYRISGAAVENLVSETRTWQTLTLTFRVGADVLANRLAFLRDTAEKYEIVTETGGGFATVDRSATGGVVRVEPPGTRRPPRTARDYLVAEYSQRPLDQAETSFEVSVAFVARTDREPDGTSTGEARADAEWGFLFRSGQVATDRVRYDFREGTNTAADTVDMTLVLDAEQTKPLEESASRLAAVAPREVPDGTNTYDDNAPNDANSVVVTTPDGTDPIPDGEYVVTEWTTEWLSDRGYRVALTLSPTDLARAGYGWAQWGGGRYGYI